MKLTIGGVGYFKMKLTVVVTTYNGSEFIEEQLESLRTQCRQADEVLILDDCSNDNTARIVQSFIDKNDLTSWKLIKNQTNVGWKRNFASGFDLATGDLIFPCDQDDIWHSDKLKCMEEAMLNNSEIDVLVGQAHYMFPEQKKTAHSKKVKISFFLNRKAHKQKEKRSGKIYKEQFDCHFKNIQQGCRMCVRKSFWDDYKIFWFDGLAHDRFFSFYSKLRGSYYVLDKDVIDYRYHLGSVTNLANRNRTERLSKLRIDQMEITSLLENIDNMECPSEYKTIIKRAARWNKYRLQLVGEKNFFAGIKLLSYLKFYPFKRHYFSDWEYAFCNDEQELYK